MTVLIVFISGLIVGSFLNSFVYRFHEGKPLFSFSERSSCPSCSHRLHWIDLVPLVSFFLLRGKCRYCTAPIRWFYPIGELVCALFFVVTWLGISQYPLVSGAEIVSALNLFFIASILAAIFISDLRYYVIPNSFLLALGVSTITFLLLKSIVFHTAFLQIFVEGIGSAVPAALFFWFLVMVSREKWMGWGDVKYSAVMGLLLGWPSVMIGILLAFVGGAIGGLFLIVLKKKTLKSEIPFGVFLTSSTLITLFWGKSLWCMIWLC